MTPSNQTSGDPTAPAPERSTDPQEVREEIRRTRDDLGDTVEALAHKADVKARARDATAAATQRAKAKAAAATQAVAGKGAQLKEQLAGATAQAASRVAGTPDETAPDHAPGLATRATLSARRPRLPLLTVAAGIVLIGWLVWRRRRG